MLNTFSNDIGSFLFDFKDLIIWLFFLIMSRISWGKEKERFCWATNLNSKEFALLSTGLLLFTNATILIHLFLLKDFNEFCMTVYSHMNSNSVLLSGEKLEAGISKRISNIILRFHFSNMKMFKVCEPAVLEGTIAICTLYSLHVTKTKVINTLIKQITLWGNFNVLLLLLLLNQCFWLSIATPSPVAVLS